MKILNLYPKSGMINFIEETISIFDLEAVEIVNPKDDMYNSDNWTKTEIGSEDLRADKELIRIYSNEENYEKIIDFYKEYILNYKIDEIQEQDWNKNWAEKFKGIEIGKGLFIRPEWIEERKDKLDIIISPGMAFGTGSHETTFLCSELIEKYIRKNDYVYDIGSGSGILSVIASKIGAKKVIAIENDEKAIENAKFNIDVNGCVNIIIKKGDLLKGEKIKSDLIIANLLEPLIIKMKDDSYKLLNENGYLIISGILESQYKNIIQNFSEDFNLIENKKLGEWNAFVFQKK